MKRYRTFLLIAMLCVSCTRTLRGPQALRAYLQDPANGLLQERTVNEVRVQVRYLPPAWQQLLDKEEQEGSDDTARHAYGNFLYFNVRLNTLSSFKADRRTQQYLDFNMAQDFELACSGDTLLPVFCQKISNGMPGSNEFIVVFNKPEEMKNGWRDFCLLYRDKLFGMGDQPFTFYRENLLKIPLIKSK